MIRRVVLSLSTVVCILCLRPVLARTWTDSSGTHAIEAEFVRVDGEVVVAKKADGTVVTMPLEKLSQPDRDFVAQEKVIADCTILIKLTQSDPNTFFKRGRALASNGDFDNAIADYSKAIELDPRFVPYYCFRSL